MADPSGYPTAEDLERIKAWPAHDCRGLVDYMRGLWWNAEWGFRESGATLQLSTGGWSGNESIIEALEQSTFWILRWQSSRRGGHYEFELPNWEQKTKE